MNEIGIMQGRLSPPPGERLQAFPWESWEQEFRHAGTCGFDTIEWLFEAEDYEQNPIWTDGGVEKIRRVIKDNGVNVRSLCADYFMIHPFFRVLESNRARSVAVLNNLIVQSASIGIATILLPVLEVSEVRTDSESAQLLESLSEPLSLAARHGIRLGLETELPACEYLGLIERARHPALGAYYDTGNASAKGYSIGADIQKLSPFLCGIHVKDRMRNGPSMLLGRGAADFAAGFEAMLQVNYNGPLVLQTAFGDQDDPISVAKTHLKFVRTCLAEAQNQR